MPHQLSAIIVGGGVFGLAAALELRRRDWRVTLIEPGPFPNTLASSTDISKVIRMDYGADDDYLEMMEECLRRWDGWNARWGEPIYHEDGFLVLTSSVMQPESFEFESHARIIRRGHKVERVDTAYLRKRFPALNAEMFRDGYFNPRGGWAESGRVVAMLAQEARDAGIEIIENTKVSNWIEQGSQVIGVRTSNGIERRADWIVVTAGAWTPTLLPEIVGMMRTIGQPVVHFRIKNPEIARTPNLGCWAADISTTGWYGFPALADGTFKVGNHGPGAPIHPDAPREVMEEQTNAAKVFLRRAFPILADSAVVHTRLCLYCDSWDGNFYIDRVPDRPGLFVAAGGSGHGFKFAPMIGELVADRIEKKTNRWSRKFAWREMGKGVKEEARFKSVETPL